MNQHLMLSLTSRNRIIGQKFGRLTVTGLAIKKASGETQYDCLCDCGGNRITTRQRLQSGHVASCGCRRFCPKARDLSGQVFGILTVVKRCGTTKEGQAIQKCLCGCGNFHEVRSGNLRNGAVKSCGCRQYAKRGAA
jgi:hypothetical protein